MPGEEIVIVLEVATLLKLLPGLLDARSLLPGGLLRLALPLPGGEGRVQASLLLLKTLLLGGTLGDDLLGSAAAGDDVVVGDCLFGERGLAI
jgi:hypothetical protein